MPIFDRLWANRFLLRQLHHQPLGAARDRAGEVQIGGGRRAARQHEGIERREFRVHRVDLVFQPLDLRVDNAQRAFAAAAAFRHAEIGAEVEQIVLDARQHVVELAAGMQPHQPMAALASSTVP